MNHVEPTHLDCVSQKYELVELLTDLDIGSVAALLSIAKGLVPQEVQKMRQVRVDDAVLDELIACAERDGSQLDLLVGLSRGLPKSAVYTLCCNVSDLPKYMKSKLRPS